MAGLIGFSFFFCIGFFFYLFNLIVDAHNMETREDVLWYFKENAKWHGLIYLIFLIPFIPVHFATVYFHLSSWLLPAILILGCDALLLLISSLVVSARFLEFPFVKLKETKTQK